MNSVGENLRRIRNEKNITQGELAKLAVISSDYISKLERGLRGNPSIDIIKKFATALNCRVEDLTGKERSEFENIEIKDVVNDLIVTKQLNSNEATIAGLILERLRKENVISENYEFTPNILKLLEEAIRLDTKLNNNIKKDKS